MSTEDQQIRRDVRHTVNVLMASALAERDLANASRVALAARVARHPYAAVAVAVCVAIAVGLGIYVTNLIRERDAQLARLRLEAPAATQGPTKSKPEFADGKGFAHTDKKLLNRFGVEGAPAAPGNASAVPEERVTNDPNALRSVRLIPMSPGGPQPAPTAAPPGLIAAPAAPPGLIVVPGVTVENMGVPRTQPPPQTPPSAAPVQLPPPGPPAAPVQQPQPPLRITTTLSQLEFDISDLVQGEVGVEVTLGANASGQPDHMRADLLNVEVLFEGLAWRKPKGRASLFECDIVRGGPTYPIELSNVRIVGDDVAIEGWMGIGADNKLKEFRFPNFSLNVVTSLEIHGKVRPNGIWDVTAKGPTYDGRDLFRSFFDVAHLGDQSTKARPGLDLRAEVDTVVGFSDTTLRSVKMFMRKRSNKLTWLDARGVLEGGKPFAAEVRHEAGQSRRLRAEAMDAGQLFKLVGFYPNAVGGAVNLEVDLDGQGPAERTGTLWVRDFLVLGDPVVSEVLQSADTTTTSGRGTDQQQRKQFEFEIMRVPFSIEHGQFVMHDAAINGRLVSASLNGKVDFRAQTLNVGGTYVPMSGLTTAPLGLTKTPAGPPRGEGPSGVTFAINGPVALPSVVVNPGVQGVVIAPQPQTGSQPQPVGVAPQTPNRPSTTPN